MGETIRPNQPTPKRERATVARGRTVLAPNGQKRVTGWTSEGKPVETAVLEHFGPGKEVELPSEEVNRLRELGYLVDPGAKVSGPPSGPNVQERAA